MSNTRKKTHRKTQEYFVEEVFTLVGDEYAVLGLYKNSATKIQMKHKECGFEYEVTPNHFTSKGRRCPDCYGTPLKTSEQFALDVQRIHGENFVVLGEYKNNKTKIKIKHIECDREFEIIPTDITSHGRGCPRCSIEKRAENATRTHMEFLEEVYKQVGNDYKVLGTYTKAQSHVKMEHNVCGHIWDVKPYHFICNESRCPQCHKMKSKDVAKIDRWLSDHGYSFVREYTFVDCKNEKVLPFDFAIFEEESLKCLIEYDGGQHFFAVEYFGGQEKLERTQWHDSIKNQYCNDNDIPLLRIPYWESKNLKEILQLFISQHTRKLATI